MDYCDILSVLKQNLNWNLNKPDIRNKHINLVTRNQEPIPILGWNRQKIMYNGCG